MYNGYGERRVRFARVTLAQIAALIPADALPSDATLHAVVLAEPTSDPAACEVRLVYTHPSFPVCLAGGDMPEVAAPTAEAPESSEPRVDETQAPQEAPTEDAPTMPESTPPAEE